METRHLVTVPWQSIVKYTWKGGFMVTQANPSSWSHKTMIYPSEK